MSKFGMVRENAKCYEQQSSEVYCAGSNLTQVLDKVDNKLLVAKVLHTSQGTTSFFFIISLTVNRDVTLKGSIIYMKTLSKRDVKAFLSLKMTRCPATLQRSLTPFKTCTRYALLNLISEHIRYACRSTLFQ